MREPTTSGTIASASNGIWQRLKRHKVVQWTLAYIALAYSLLHGLELVGHGFHWPDIVYRVATVLLILGVPVSCIVAWYHGHRAQHRVSGTELSMLTVLLVIAGTALWIVALPSSAPPGVDTGTAAALASPMSADRLATAPQTAIAVLPFANLTGDPGKEYFSDGMAEELINTPWCWLPELRELHRDARFDRLVTEVGFKAYWRRFGPPDGCELRNDELRCH